MKYIKTQDGRDYIRASRWIRIECKDVTARHSLADYADGDTLLYFRHGGRVYALGQFLRLTYPEFFEDENGKTSYLSAYDATNYYNPYLMEVHPNGEHIRLYREVTAV